ncbi:MAG TPA: dihydroorotase [Flavobacterium sp.]|nr:dihydroorotase [Flavobacterium sp.]
MNLIIREAKIIDATSDFHNKVVDLLISDGILKAIGSNLANDDKFDELKLVNLHVSEGWFDSSVSFGEPGFEDRETIMNGLDVAAKSGFTAVALQPNSYPIIDNQSQIGFVRSKSMNSATALYSIGALTKKSEGLDLAELFDMKNAGAVAFGDYNKNIDNANLLKIALQYAQDFDGLVLAFSEDTAIKGSGVANEGIAATSLGLKGIPALAEDLQVARNLFLLEYTGGKLHIPTISSARSVELIRDAKAKGLDVTCSVSVHHLVLTDDILSGFDTRYKVSPPLRSNADRVALLQGIRDGVIDMITSDHNPIDIEHKKMEFDRAADGTIGLESAFGALCSVLPLEKVAQMLVAGKERFGIGRNGIAEGSKASLSLFNPDQKYIFSKKDILSKSKNAAFLGQELQGRAYGIINQNKLVLRDHE